MPPQHLSQPKKKASLFKKSIWWSLLLDYCEIKIPHILAGPHGVKRKIAVQSCPITHLTTHQVPMRPAEGGFPTCCNCNPQGNKFPIIDPSRSHDSNVNYAQSWYEVNLGKTPSILHQWYHSIQVKLLVQFLCLEQQALRRSGNSEGGLYHLLHRHQAYIHAYFRLYNIMILYDVASSSDIIYIYTVIHIIPYPNVKTIIRGCIYSSIISCPFNMSLVHKTSQGIMGHRLYDSMNFNQKL